jgi:hypothetical protein
MFECSEPDDSDKMPSVLKAKVIEERAFQEGFVDFCY